MSRVLFDIAIAEGAVNGMAFDVHPHTPLTCGPVCRGASGCFGSTLVCMAIGFFYSVSAEAVELGEPDSIDAIDNTSDLRKGACCASWREMKYKRCVCAIASNIYNMFDVLSVLERVPA